MKILYQLDKWVLESVFETFSRWFQRLTGKTCFWLARVVTVAIIFLFSKSIFESNSWGERIITGLCISMEYFVYKILIPRVEAEVTTSLHRSMRNHRAKTFRQSRILALILSFSPICGGILGVILGHSEQLHLLIFAIAYVSQMYLICCTPLPPGKSKIREGVDRMKTFFVPQLIPIPA